MDLTQLEPLTTAGVPIPAASRNRGWSAARGFVARAAQGLTWRGIVVLIGFCAIYGGLFALDPQTGGAPRSLAAYLHGFTAALICFAPVFLVVTVAVGFGPRRPLVRGFMLALAVVIGVAAGQGVILGAQDVMLTWEIVPPRHVASVIPLLAIGWMGLAIHLLRERDQAARQALHDETERQVIVGRQMSEAQLQVLQSQIEPHFLFNSLAHLRRLYQVDPAKGRAMMGHLSRYLSCALPAMREPGIALRLDLELAAAYLHIQQTRMGARLEFEIQVPEDLQEARVPPMMLTTLVENSIKHGLSPLPEGGSVKIAAQRNGNALEISVSDTGQGFQSSLGAGVGLANTRARLASLHGTAARLTLSQNRPRGVTATIFVPMRVALPG